MRPKFTRVNDFLRLTPVCTTSHNLRQFVFRFSSKRVHATQGGGTAGSGNLSREDGRDDWADLDAAPSLLAA